MEGSTVEYMANDNLIMEFHSHFVDKSDQNYASTHAHMKVLMKHLNDNNLIKSRQSTLWDFTDVCAKQYRCSAAVFLLSALAMEYNIVIDRQVDAPGHGKGNVDGHNAVDKLYL